MRLIMVLSLCLTWLTMAAAYAEDFPSPQDRQLWYIKYGIEPTIWDQDLTAQLELGHKLYGHNLAPEDALAIGKYFVEKGTTEWPNHPWAKEVELKIVPTLTDLQKFYPNDSIFPPAMLPEQRTIAVFSLRPNVNQNTTNPLALYLMKLQNRFQQDFPLVFDPQHLLYAQAGGVFSRDEGHQFIAIGPDILADFWADYWADLNDNPTLAHEEFHWENYFEEKIEKKISLVSGTASYPNGTYPDTMGRLLNVERQGPMPVDEAYANYLSIKKLLISLNDAVRARDDLRLARLIELLDKKILYASIYARGAYRINTYAFHAVIRDRTFSVDPTDREIIIPIHHQFIYPNHSVVARDYAYILPASIFGPQELEYLAEDHELVSRMEPVFAANLFDIKSGKYQPPKLSLPPGKIIERFLLQQNAFLQQLFQEISQIRKNWDKQKKQLATSKQSFLHGQCASILAQIAQKITSPTPRINNYHDFLSKAGSSTHQPLSPKIVDEITAPKL